MSEEKVIREKHSQPSLVYTNCVLEFTHPRNSCSQCLLLMETLSSTARFEHIKSIHFSLLR